MRIAVLSDIHGNLHALDAVLAEIDGVERECRRRLRDERPPARSRATGTAAAGPKGD